MYILQEFLLHCICSKFIPRQNSTKPYKWENWKEDFTTLWKISKVVVFYSNFWNSTIIWQIPMSGIDQNQFLSLQVKVYCRSKAFFVLSKLQLQGLLQMNLCICHALIPQCVENIFEAIWISVPYFHSGSFGGLQKHFKPHFVIWKYRIRNDDSTVIKRFGKV